MDILFDIKTLPMLVLLLFSFCILLFIMCIICLVFIRKLDKRLDRFMGTKTERHNLEEALMDYFGHVDMVDTKYKKLLKEIDHIYGKLENCIQKVGIVRYNPFDNMGGDLSYSLTLLDDQNDGIIINTIFSRESSHTYCKPVNQGKSEYILSYEEELSLKRALGQEKKRGHDLKAPPREEYQDEYYEEE